MFLFSQSDAFYGTGTIALNDKLSLPLQDQNNEYEMKRIDDIQEMELKNFEVRKCINLSFY